MACSRNVLGSSIGGISCAVRLRSNRDRSDAVLVRFRRPWLSTAAFASSVVVVLALPSAVSLTLSSVVALSWAARGACGAEPVLVPSTPSPLPGLLPLPLLEGSDVSAAPVVDVCLMAVEAEKARWGLLSRYVRQAGTRRAADREARSHRVCIRISCARGGARP